MVNAVGGDAFGTVDVVVFPTLMYRGAVQNLGVRASAFQKCEDCSLRHCSEWLGIVMGGSGVLVANCSHEFQLNTLSFVF